MNVETARRELEAAKVLREHIAALAEGDEETIRDTLEGEGDLDRLVGDLLASIGEDEAHVAGLKSYLDELKDRRTRIAERIELKRTLVASAMEIAGRPTIETDVATATLAKSPPAVIVTEEADVPAEFWRAAAPVLDKKALAAALKQGRQIPGATLSNGGTTLKITRS